MKMKRKKLPLKNKRSKKEQVKRNLHKEEEDEERSAPE
jgi:hypothetical protein